MFLDANNKEINIGDHVTMTGYGISQIIKLTKKDEGVFDDVADIEVLQCDSKTFYHVTAGSKTRIFTKYLVLVNKEHIENCRILNIFDHNFKRSNDDV